MSATQKTTPPTEKLQDDLISKSAEASTVLTKAQAIAQSAKDLLNTAKKTVALAKAREKDPSTWLSSAREINDSFRNLLKTVASSEKAIDKATSDVAKPPKSDAKNKTN